MKTQPLESAWLEYTLATNNSEFNGPQVSWENLFRNLGNSVAAAARIALHNERLARERARTMLNGIPMMRIAARDFAAKYLAAHRPERRRLRERVRSMKQDFDFCIFAGSLPPLVREAVFGGDRSFPILNPDEMETKLNALIGVRKVA